MEKQIALTDYVDVLDEYVLIKQVMRIKNSRIIMDAATQQKDKFDFYFEIVQKGEGCKRKIKVGQSPIFGEYVKFSGVRVIEKTKQGMITLVIVHENEIIGIDKQPEIIELEKEETNDEIHPSKN